MGTRRSKHNLGRKPTYKDFDRETVRRFEIGERPKREKIVPLVRNRITPDSPNPTLAAEVEAYLARKKKEIQEARIERPIEHVFRPENSGLAEMFNTATSDRDIIMQLYLARVISKTQLWGGRMWQHYFEESTIQPSTSIDPSAPLSKQHWQKGGDLYESQHRAMMIRKIARSAVSLQDITFLDTVLQPDVGRAEAIRIFCVPLETIVRRLKILLRGLAVYFGYSTDIGGYEKFSAAELVLQKYKMAWQATMAPEKMNIEAIRRTLASMDKEHAT